MSDGWTDVKVGDVVHEALRPVKVEAAKEYPLLGVRWYGGGPFVREIGVGGVIKATRLFSAKPGDFIYNRLFAWKGSFGVVPTSMSGCFVSGEFPLFAVDTDRLLVEYLRIVMCQPHVWAQIERESTGSTAASRNRWKEDRFLSWPIVLPPLDEQRRIVDLITAVDQSIAATEEAAAASEITLESLRNSIEVISDGADRMMLGEIADVVGGVTKDKSKQHEHFVEVPYLRVANVQRGYLDLAAVVSIRAASDKVAQLALAHGDVLFNEGGDRDKLGRGWVWEEQLPVCIHQNHVFRARLTDERVDPYFLAMWSNSATAQRWFETMGSQTTNLASINLKTLKSFPVPLIPKAAQRDLVSTYLAVSDVSRAVQDERASLKSLRSTLLSSLLVGDRIIPESYDELLEAAV